MIYNEQHSTGVRFPSTSRWRTFVRLRAGDRRSDALGSGSDDQRRHRGLPKSEVPGAFDVGARAYDRLVGANPGYHDHLRISARRMRIPNGGRGYACSTPGGWCLDGGTARGRPHAEIVAVDASAGMLAEAAEKSWPDSVRFVHTPIEDLADAGVHGPFDGILAAYLLRNLDDPDTQLRAFREILRPWRHPWPCTSTGAGLPPGVGHLGRRLLGHHHPVRLEADP